MKLAEAVISIGRQLVIVAATDRGRVMFMGDRRDAFAARREAMGYTQEGLAAAVGVEFSTVGRWERGALTPQP